MSILSDESRPLLDVGRIGSDPSIGAAAKEQASYRLLAVTWVAFATIIRFASVARLPLANGEAYYATWSRFLDWSYYDHPPLVAWMVRAHDDARRLFRRHPARPGALRRGVRPSLLPTRRALLRASGGVPFAHSRDGDPGVPGLELRAQPRGATRATLGGLPPRARGNARARRVVPAPPRRRCFSAPRSSRSTPPCSSCRRRSSTSRRRHPHADGCGGRRSTREAPSRSRSRFRSSFGTTHMAGRRCSCTSSSAEAWVSPWRGRTR